MNMTSYSGQDILTDEYFYELTKKYGWVCDVDKANIPERYLNLTPDSLVPEMDEIKKKFEHYFWKEGKSILLVSDAPGAGKTTLGVTGCYAGRHNITNKKHYVARFISYKDIPDQDSYDEADKKFWEQTKFHRTWIIDDVQMDTTRVSKKRLENFKTFIERLYNSNSQFVLTTTLTKTQLKAFIGVNIMSRINEMAIDLFSKIENCRDDDFKASNNVEKI